jgi:hypothetical protein
MDDIAPPIEPANNSEVAWPWRSRTASTERSRCLRCDELLGQHAFRYCSKQCGDAAHERAQRLFGEMPVPTKRGRKSRGRRS